MRTRARPSPLWKAPKIGTTATVDGQHTAEPTGEVTIVDAVAYTGLTPGETYTVSGVLDGQSLQASPCWWVKSRPRSPQRCEFTP